MGFDLCGKTVLLTGATSGVGWELAKALGRTGAILSVSGRQEDALTQLALQIRADGGRAHVLASDLSLRGNAADLADRARATMGRVDVLINNAGLGMAASQWAGGDGDDARGLVEVNYWSPLALVSALVPEMRAKGEGAVVNVASLGVPFEMTGHSASSNAALAIATDALSDELRGSGVRAMLVLPDPIEAPVMAAEFARFVVRGLERGARQVVYPRRMFPLLSRWAGAWIRRVRAESPRLVA